jgi:hypothetical protein
MDHLSKNCVPHPRCALSCPMHALFAAAASTSSYCNMVSPMVHQGPMHTTHFILIAPLMPLTCSAPTHGSFPAACVTIPGIRAGRPDRPGQATQTKTRGTARTTMRQKRYDESTFSARLAEALRRHGVAVRTARTSSSVMRDITDQLARLASTGGKSNSDEDVPARHGPHGPERPPRR